MVGGAGGATGAGEMMMVAGAVSGVGAGLGEVVVAATVGKLLGGAKGASASGRSGVDWEDWLAGASGLELS